MLIKRALDSPAVQVDVITGGLDELDADVLVVGLAEGDDLPAELAGQRFAVRKPDDHEVRVELGDRP